MTTFSSFDVLGVVFPNFMAAIGYFVIAAVLILRHLRLGEALQTVPVGVFLTCGAHHVAHPLAMYWGVPIVQPTMDWAMMIWAVLGAYWTFQAYLQAKT